MARSTAHKNLDRQISEARRYRDRLNVLVAWDQVMFEFILLPARLGPWMAARTRGKKLPKGVGLPDEFTLLLGIVAHDKADWTHVPSANAPSSTPVPRSRAASNARWQAQIIEDNLIWTDPLVQRQSGISPYVGQFLATYLNDAGIRADFLIGLGTLGNTDAATYDKDKLEKVRQAFDRYQTANCGLALPPIVRLATDINAISSPQDRWGICEWYGFAPLLHRRGIDATSPEGAQMMAACIALAEPSTGKGSTNDIDAERAEIVFGLL